MPYVVERKNILINQYFAAADASITKEIYLPFIPDEVIVKYAGILITNPSNTNPYAIQTDLISENNGYLYYQRSVASGNPNVPVNLSYSLKKPVSGIYTFRLIDILNSSVAPFITTGDMVIHLEFVKYNKFGKGGDF